MKDEEKQGLIALTSETLNHQICTICSNYLSVGPVKISERHKICGRCADKYPKLLTVPSLYELVANRFLFQCINYYGGCKKILSYNEAKKHEQTCTPVLLRCAICSFISNSCRLIKHLTKMHGFLITEDGIFNFKLSFGLTRILYIQDNNLFCLVIYIKVNCAYVFNQIVTPKNENTILCNLTFFKNHTNARIRTPQFRILEIPITNQCSSNIYYQKSNELFSQYQNYFTFNIQHLKNTFDGRSCCCQIGLIGRLYDFADNEIKYLQYEQLIVPAVSFNRCKEACQILRAPHLYQPRRQVLTNNNFPTPNQLRNQMLTPCDSNIPTTLNQLRNQVDPNHELIRSSGRNPASTKCRSKGSICCILIIIIIIIVVVTIIRFS